PVTPLSFSDRPTKPARQLQQHSPLLLRGLRCAVPPPPLGNEVGHPPPPPLLAALEHAGDPLRQNPHENVIAMVTEGACHLLIRCPRRQLAGRHALQHLVHRVAEVSS